MRPEDLLGRGETARGRGIRPPDVGRAPHRVREFAASDLDDPAGAANLLLLRREGGGLVGLSARLVDELSRLRIERERVTFLRILDRRSALDHVQSEVQGVPAEDVAHRRPADDDHLYTRLVGDAFESGRTHLTGTADREAIAGDEKRLASVDALAKVRHEVAEGTRLPALVESVEAFRDAVVGRRDLVRVDGVELLPRDLGIPEDQRLPADDLAFGGPRRALG